MIKRTAPSDIGLLTAALTYPVVGDYEHQLHWHVNNNVTSELFNRVCPMASQ